MNTRRDLARLIGAAGAAAALPALAAAGPARIDVHHHHVPPAFLKANGYERIPQMRDWTPARAVEEMDRNGIAVGMASLNAPGIALNDRDASRALARACNEFAARMQQDHPGRFGSMAGIPMLDVDGALAEIAYAFDVLKADGIGIVTSYAGKYLGNAAFTPILEELNRRKAVVFCHPLLPQCCAAPQPEVPASYLEMPLDTPRTILSLVLTGALVRFPDIRFIFAHGGGALPVLHERIDFLSGGTEAASKSMPDGLMAALRNVWFDTVLVANRPDYAMMSQLYGPERLLLGTDYPFVPAANQIRGLDSLRLPAARRRAIERGNALALFPRLAN